MDKVSFTASTAAGRRIASICGERIAGVTLELGGKSPVIIPDDDVEKAAQTLAGTAPIMTGQACSLLTRIMVSERRHDDLVDALASALGKTEVGDPSDPE